MMNPVQFGATYTKTIQPENMAELKEKLNENFVDEGDNTWCNNDRQLLEDLPALQPLIDDTVMLTLDEEKGQLTFNTPWSPDGASAVDLILLMFDVLPKLFSTDVLSEVSEILKHRSRHKWVTSLDKPEVNPDFGKELSGMTVS